MLNSPFMQAGANRVLGKSLLKTSKFSFNGIITNLEKTVSTINQVVPLYNQVRPLISSSKSIINTFKATRNNKPTPKPANNNTNLNVINVEATPTNQTIKKDVFVNQDTPDKPFFN